MPRKHAKNRRNRRRGRDAEKRLNLQPVIQALPAFVRIVAALVDSYQDDNGDQ